MNASPTDGTTIRGRGRRDKHAGFASAQRAGEPGRSYIAPESERRPTSDSSSRSQQAMRLAPALAPLLVLLALGLTATAEARQADRFPSADEVDALLRREPISLQ